MSDQCVAGRPVPDLSTVSDSVTGNSMQVYTTIVCVCVLHVQHVCDNGYV